MDLSGLSWRKSSHSSSNGACVEVGVAWHTSTYSAGTGGDCAEVGVGWRQPSHSGSAGGNWVGVGREVAAVVAVRDSKDPQGPVLTFSAAEWRAFTGRIKSGASGCCPQGSSEMRIAVPLPGNVGAAWEGEGMRQPASGRDA